MRLVRNKYIHYADLGTVIQITRNKSFEGCGFFAEDTGEFAHH